MYSDIEEENDLEYSIRTSNKNDVILLFTTIKCSEINSYYIYTAMGNPIMPHFINDIITPYINNGYSSSLINFLDGWVDYGWDNKISSSEKLKFKNILISFLRTDKIKLDEFYIPILYNIFNISYYAETMIG